MLKFVEDLVEACRVGLRLPAGAVDKQRFEREHPPLAFEEFAADRAADGGFVQGKRLGDLAVAHRGAVARPAMEEIRLHD